MKPTRTQGEHVKVHTHSKAESGNDPGTLELRGVDSTRCVAPIKAPGPRKRFHNKLLEINTREDEILQDTCGNDLEF